MMASNRRTEAADGLCENALPARRRLRCWVTGLGALLVAIGVVGAYALAPLKRPPRHSPRITAAALTAPLVFTFGNHALGLVDSPGHAAVLALREDPDNHNDAIVASADHLNVGGGCKYLSQTDTDPSNDTAPGYDLWLRCPNVTGQWILNLDDANDQISVSHPTRTTPLSDGKNIQILAGDGDDTVTILDGSASVDGQGGNDTIRGGPDDDVIHGGTGYDKLVSGRGRGAAHDELYGDAGNDTLLGGRNSDILDGGPGLDVIKPGGAHDVINARDGEADEVDCGGDDGVADAMHFDPGVDKLFHCAAEIKKNPGGA